MEKDVNGIYERFFTDLIEGYAGDREASFLYKAYWTEEVKKLFRWLLREEKKKKAASTEEKSGSVEKLLREHFSWLPPEEILDPEKDALRFRTALGNILRDGPEWVRDLLLNTEDKKREDPWRDFQLNDAGFQGELIEPAKYYLWLAEYLTENDSYYKNKTISGDMKKCLCRMLEEGLRGTKQAPDPGWEQVKAAADGRKIRVSIGEQIQEKLETLAALLKKEQEDGQKELADRLQALKCCVGCEKCSQKENMEKWSHLLCLTAQMEKKALHDTIGRWLRDSGHPIDADGREMFVKKLRRKEKYPEEAQEKAGKENAAKMSWEKRKQDFTMQLFAAYCDSEEGYRFDKKSQGGGTYYKNWKLIDNGFCMLDVDEEQLDTFISAWKTGWNEYLYIPLAVHLPSGCVFFLAGSGNYNKLYKELLRKAKGNKDLEKVTADIYKTYKKNAEKQGYCYDYLVLDRKRWADIMGDSDRPEPLGVGIPLRPKPVFHKRAGKSYRTVLAEFMNYCIEHNFDDAGHAKDSPLDALRAGNAEWPEDAPPIPDVFKGFFMDYSDTSDDAASDELDNELENIRKKERSAERKAGSREAEAAFRQSREKALDIFIEAKKNR